MARFLRDRFIKNVILDEDGLTDLDFIINERAKIFNESPEATDREKLSVSYMVRFDGRGYRSTTLEDALRYFKGGKTVERVALTAESQDSLATNRVIGPFLEVRFDRNELPHSFMVASAEDQDWVEASAGAIDDWLERRKSITARLVRTRVTPLLVQLSGVVLMFLVSLWAASVIGPRLQGVEYPRLIVFGITAVVASNLWAFVFQLLVAQLFSLIPNVLFRRKGSDFLSTLAIRCLQAFLISVMLIWANWVADWARVIVSPFFLASP